MKMKYIIVTDDGTVFKTYKLTYNDYDMYDDGVIVQIFDTETCKEWRNDEWYDVDIWG